MAGSQMSMPMSPAGGELGSVRVPGHRLHLLSWCGEFDGAVRRWPGSQMITPLARVGGGSELGSVGAPGH